MPANQPDPPQGPFEGSRCVAGPDGHWGPATIRRVNEDGTFQVEFDVKELIIMPTWYGVTPAEISFEDERQWEGVFALLSPDGRSLARKNFPDALALLGYKVPPDQARELWDQGCQKLINVSGYDAEDFTLDEAKTYQIFLHLGISAKLCAENLKPDRPKPYFKLYWNQTRMGGREPAEVPRRVTLDDAFAALGLRAGKEDRSTAASLQKFEREHAVRLPATLADLLRRPGVADAVKDCHPNNPAFVEFKQGRWELRSGMRQQQVSGDYALVILTPHQGDHEWAVVFDDGEDDARVYLRWDTEEGEAWLPTAPGVGMFFWDLAQTGLAWYQDTRFKGGRPAKRSDIGLILDS
jgi:hypothetical protein